MTGWNHAAYAWLNASADLHGGLLTASVGLAQYAIWLVPLWVVASWFWGSARGRCMVVAGTLAVAAALLINHGLSLVIFEPRPFMVSEGHTYITHAPDTSFPSDHATVLWTLAVLTFAQRPWRTMGLGFAALASGVGWARVFLGLHYPIDMAGALAVGLIAGGAGGPLAIGAAQRCVPVLERLYRWIFMKAIARGWVRA